MGWLLEILGWFRLRGMGVGVSVPLPAFRRAEGEMRQSSPSDKGPEDVPGVASSRDYRHAHPELIKRFSSLATEYSSSFPGRSLIVTCTYRSPAEQWRLYSKGRFGNPGPRVTNCDGREKPSNHNRFPAVALDVMVVDGGKGSYEESLYWPLAALCKKHYLVSGGSWVGFQDWPHIELPRGVR